MSKQDYPHDGKFYSMASSDKGSIDTYASTLDGELFNVMSVLAGQEGVVVATNVSYEDAKDCARAEIAKAKAKRAAHILATIPMGIIQLDHKWALEYK